MKAAAYDLPGSQLEFDVKHRNIRSKVDLHDITLGAWRLSEFDNFYFLTVLKPRGYQFPRRRVRIVRCEHPLWIVYFARTPFGRTTATEFCDARVFPSREHGQLMPD